MVNQMKIMNSKKLKYLYGNQNAILNSDRSVESTMKKEEKEDYKDNKVNVDLSYLKRNSI